MDPVMANEGGIAVFLDRDGVINVRAADDAYVTTWSEFVFIPGAIAAMAALGAAGATLFVVTNQRGVARGLIEPTNLDDIHERMTEGLGAAGADVAGIYVCPHEVGTCACRKPGVGLFRQAQLEHPWIDFGRSHMIGDSLSDAQAAAALGMPIWLVGADVARVAHEAGELGMTIAGTARDLAELTGDGELLSAIGASSQRDRGPLETDR